MLLNGEDITFEAEHKRAKVIGRLFQDPARGTAPDMTIEENLALAYNRKGSSLRMGLRRRIPRCSAKSWRSWTWASKAA